MFKRKLLATSLILLTPQLFAEQENNVSHNLDIQVEQVGPALNRLAEQSGVEILYLSNDVEGITTQPIDGEYSVQQALDMLLQGTSLKYEVDENDRVYIKSSSVSVGGGQGLLLADNGAATTSLYNSSNSAEPAEEKQPVVTGRSIEEVTVTSRRREESLQAVPISVTAFSPEDIQSATMTDIGQLAELTPGFNTLSAPGDTQFVPNIRGHVQGEVSAASDPAVGVYVDEVYYAYTTGSLANTFDVERVEVLKGPQGTLFGRNSTGGAISITTKRPNHDGISGVLQTKIGSDGRRDLNGMINLPLVEDKLSARFVMINKEQDGFFTSPLTGAEFRGEDQTSFRGSILWDISEDTSLTLIVDESESETGGAFYFLAPTALSAPGAGNFVNSVGLLEDATRGLGPDADGYSPTLAQVNRSIDDIFDDGTILTGSTTGAAAESEGIQLIGETSVGGIDFKAITAYREAFNRAFFDLDGSEVGSFSTRIDDGGDQFTVELQASSSNELFGNNLDWVGGIFYLDQSGFSETIGILFPHFDTDASDGLNRPFLRSVDEENESKAAYFQFDYEFIEDTRFTAGIRYTKDDKKQIGENFSGLFATEADAAATGGLVTSGWSYTNFAVDYSDGLSNLGAVFPSAASGEFSTCRYDSAVLDAPDVCRATIEDSFSEISWTLGLDHQFVEDDDRSIYGFYRFSRGYRSGGHNLRGSNAAGLEPFEPEFVDVHEIGIKADWLNKRLRTNVNFFYEKYSDIQLTVIDGIPPVSRTENAAEATFIGGELEVIALATDNLKLSTTMAWLDQEFDEFTESVNTGGACSTPTGVLLPGGQLCDRSSEAFLDSPELTATFSAEYMMPLSVGNLVLRGDYIWRDDTTLLPTNPIPDNQQDAFGLINLRASLKLMDDLVDLSLYCRNCADEAYWSNVQSLGVGIEGVGAPGVPRHYGLEATWRFE